ncbi:MAG: hypothetical protein A2086_04230 [Spirochaetes bacterium GWD1_27_9]|nr:MAG: hypothetical protein A2Z98_18025 [Spirochaetes bacterium GWB1_27_13]OHD23042.1 MAG: hypothetical protein A2Y34_17835 [Spirochaetes bacterium GWC1_27_15]OHD41366.1 MAG: hypothetical protein A2086_04230 [Spirochaetes bacterium GWD1_27_9]
MIKKILIVEDEIINAIFLKTILTKNNFEVLEIADNAIDAINIAAEQNPDLILMDIKLNGDMDGINAIKEIQKIKPIDHIYVTAYDDKNIIRRALETNPKNIIPKPINIIDFLRNIE